MVWKKIDQIVIGGNAESCDISDDQIDHNRHKYSDDRYIVINIA